MASIQINQPAPDFELVDIHDQTIRLSDFKDHQNVVLVLNRGFM